MNATMRASASIDTIGKFGDSMSELGDSYNDFQTNLVGVENGSQANEYEKQQHASSSSCDATDVTEPEEMTAAAATSSPTSTRRGRVPAGSLRRIRRSLSRKRSTSDGSRKSLDGKKHAAVDDCKNKQNTQPSSFVQQEGEQSPEVGGKIRVVIRKKDGSKSSPKSRKTIVDKVALAETLSRSSSTSGENRPKLGRKSSSHKIKKKTTPQEVLEKVKKSNKKDLNDFFNDYDAIHGEDYRSIFHLQKESDGKPFDGNKSLTGW